MFVPVVAGSDKTTVSVATGHQEYHPVYVPRQPREYGSMRSWKWLAPCRIPSNTKKYGFSLLFYIFAYRLGYDTASKKHRKKAKFQAFCQQMYHACLARIFAPLRDGMVTPEVVKCPDGHFRRAVYGLGPYIADYPEQVWLAAVIQGWCPK